MTRGRARELGSRSDGLKFLRSGERSRSPDRHRTVAIIRDLGDAWSHLVRPISIVQTAANRVEHGDCADHNLTATTHRGRTPRSRPDRTAIAARSSRNHTLFIVESIPRMLSGFLPRIGGTIDADQSPIVAEIVVNRGGNRGLFGG